MVISLILLPGSGQADVSLPEGSTLADLVRLKNLTGRQLVLMGESIPASRYADTVLVSGQEVGAIGASKGN
jgi:sulfur carrier protein ThiS